MFQGKNLSHADVQITSAVETIALILNSSLRRTNFENCFQVINLALSRSRGQETEGCCVRALAV